MHPTLFHVPKTLFGHPVFGVGLLLFVWVLVSAGILVWLARRQGFNADTWSHVPILAVIAAAIVFVLPALCDEEGLPIRGYGVMFLIAVLSGTALAFWRARRRGIDPELVFSMAVWVCVAGFLGARLFYVVEYWQHFVKDTLAETLVALINVTEGGLVVYGAYAGGAAGLLGFLRKYRLPTLPWFDLAAPCLILGVAIGRIGCFVNGCCFGGVCDLPWSVQFPWGSPAHTQQVHQGDTDLYGLTIEGPKDAEPGEVPPVITEVQPGSIAAERGLKPGDRIIRIQWLRPGQKQPQLSKDPDQPREGETKYLTAAQARQDLIQRDRPGTKLWIEADRGETSLKVFTWEVPKDLPPSLPVQPTQLYSSIHAFLLCLFLLALEPFVHRDGVLTATALTIYPINRFLLEIIRTDESSVFGTGMSISQNVSLLILVVAAALWVYLLRRPRGRVYWPEPGDEA